MSFKRRLIEATIGRVMFRATHVVRTEEVAPAFWRIELAGDALRGARYAPGDKLQVLLDDGPRTYSPFAFDAARGTLGLLSYAHGDSSGARWGPTAREGDKVQVFGPRGSIPLTELGPAIVLVGDETTFGIARALHELHPATARYVFEVNAADAAAKALAHLQLAEPVLVARRPADAHHGELADRIRAALRATRDATLVLTGKASSIQAVRASLKATPAPHTAQRAKAYWAPGKRGLD